MGYHADQAEAKPHMCQYCGYKCREANNLKRHMALHFEAERNFVCEVCGAAFHAKKTLEVHTAYKHSEFRAFKCDECDLSFKARNALTRHKKVHSAEKDHRCWCGAAFKRMYNLRRHLQTVHGKDDMLPPVRRVQTLDKSNKDPISRTDLAVPLVHINTDAADTSQIGISPDTENGNEEVEGSQFLRLPSISSSLLQQDDNSFKHKSSTNSAEPDLQDLDRSRYISHIDHHNSLIHHDIHLQHFNNHVQSSYQQQQQIATPLSSPSGQGEARHGHSMQPSHSPTPNPILNGPSTHTAISPDDGSQRPRYNPVVDGLYTNLSVPSAYVAVDQNDPYNVQSASSGGSFVPQAVAYSTILRELGSQFQFLQDGQNHNYCKQV